MYSVLDTLSEYTYFYILKNITSYTFLLVFKIVESPQCILECVKEFLHRFDLRNGKYFSIFQGAFARIVKVTHFAQVISFFKMTHRRIHTCKVDKNIVSLTQQQKQEVSQYYCAGY